MNEQIKELALRTGEAIYDAVGNDPKTLAAVMTYIASSIADGIREDSSYIDGLVFLGGATDNLDKLGQVAVALLSEDERTQLEASIND